MTLVELLVTLGVMVVLIALLLPAISRVREAGRRTACLNKFRQLGHASHGFESARRRFPRNDALSWTQELAAFMEDGSASTMLVSLATASDTDRDRLLRLRPASHVCPSARETTVSDYPTVHMGFNAALLGARTADVRDGLAKTLLLGELQPALGAPWVLGPTVLEPQFGSDHGAGGTICAGDGSVHSIPMESVAAMLPGLLTPGGGELLQLR